MRLSSCLVPLSVLCGSHARAISHVRRAVSTDTSATAAAAAATSSPSCDLVTVVSTDFSQIPEWLVMKKPSLKDDLQNLPTTLGDIVNSTTSDIEKTIKILHQLQKLSLGDLSEVTNIICEAASSLEISSGEDPWVGNKGNLPPLPTDDSFYNYTRNDLSSYDLGTVLDWREVFSANYTWASQMFQVLYRTEDHAGNPQATVALVMVPKNSTNDRIMVFNEANDEVYANCHPSYTLLTTQADPALELMMSRGFSVIAADFVGPDSAFGSGISAGRRTLDSVRAANNMRNFTKLSSSPKVALWGFSGGSLGVGHAIEQKDWYAPELNIAAAAVGGFVVNLTASFEVTNGASEFGYVPAAIVGLSREYNEIANVLHQKLRPETESKFYDVEHECGTTYLTQYANQNISTYLEGGIDGLLTPEVLNVLQNNSLGHSAPQGYPVFIYHGTNDEVEPISEVDKTVSFYKSQGTDVKYWRVPLSSHSTSYYAALLPAADFLTSNTNLVEP